MVIIRVYKIRGGVNKMAASVVGIGEIIKFYATIFSDTAAEIIFTIVSPEDAVINVFTVMGSCSPMMRSV